MFFIGGYGISSPLSVIAKYENDKWSLHGNLKRRRNVHGSITYGTTTIVIGGYTNDVSKLLTKTFINVLKTNLVRLRPKYGI